MNSRLSNMSKLLIKICLLFVSTLSVMCTGVVSPAIPLIKKSFTNIEHIDLILKMMVVMPNFFIGISAPLAGYLSQKVNKKILLVSSLVGYGIFGSVGFYANSIHVILIFRGLLGLTIAFLTTSSTAMIGEYFSNPTERGKIIGMQSTCMCIGSVVYTMMAGFLADMNWRYIFLIYCTGIAIAPLILTFRKSSQNHDKEMNKKEDDAFILQNNFVIAMICLINMVIMILFYLIKLQLPFIIYELPKMTAKSIAFAFSVETMCAAIISLRYQRFKKNRDYAIICATGFLIISFSYILIGASKNFNLIIFGMLICGVGMGIMQPNTILWLLSVTRPKNRGIIIGFYTTSTYFGKFLSPIVMMPLIKITKVSHSFFISSFLMLVISVAAMFFNDYLSRINRAKLRNVIKKAKQQGYKV